MNNFLTNLQKEARHLRLTQEEKQGVRVRLYEAMEEAPRTAAASAPARAVRSPYHWFSPRTAGAFAAVLIVALGGGTAFAAQGALPGSPLYPMKVNVNDVVRVALATTPQAKALANAAVAEERLDEAQALEAQGLLNATTTQELQQNFDEHAALAIALVASTSPAEALAVEEGASFIASTTAMPQPQEETASSSLSTPSRERFATRPFMKTVLSTTSASTSPVSPEAATSTPPQGEGAFEDIPATLERQRQMFEAIRQRVESRADHGDH